MKRNGFIASSLLYGMLALFLVIMLSTLGVFASNKISMDKLKSKALGDVGKDIPTITVDELKVSTVISGDGLYIDGDKYVYRGASPDNYIVIEGELYRIISIESTGIKVMRDEVLVNMAFDNVNNRDNGSNGSGGTYCTLSNGQGCNVWAALTNIIGNPSSYVNGSVSGTVLKDASLNTYLNDDYYVNVLKSNPNIIRGTFNIGPSGNESSYKWQGYVALATESEYLNANSNQSQCASVTLNNTNKDICVETNYLYKLSGYTRLLTPSTGDVYYGLVINDGHFENYTATGDYGVRPVLYLSTSINLSGDGTSSNPYKIV